MIIFKENEEHIIVKPKIFIIIMICMTPSVLHIVLNLVPMFYRLSHLEIYNLVFIAASNLVSVLFCWKLAKKAIGTWHPFSEP